jgi:hypothetical protein
LERKEFTMIIMPILLNPLSLLGAAMKNGQSMAAGAANLSPPNHVTTRPMSGQSILRQK